jgi:hypothetical protein
MDDAGHTILRRTVAVTRAVLYSAALNRNGPALSGTRPALSGTRPACVQEWYMYHLPGGAEQEKKEKGRTCDRSLTRNFPKPHETSPESLPVFP